MYGGLFVYAGMKVVTKTLLLIELANFFNFLPLSIIMWGNIAYRMSQGAGSLAFKLRFIDSIELLEGGE